MTDISRPASEFDDLFRASLIRLFQLRRDVRHFQTKPVPIDLLKKLVRAAKLAPSVGLSEPWRLISVESDHLRKQIVEEYVAANQQASEQYSGETKGLYQSLKLAGLKEAPVHFAVFVDAEPTQGKGLGRQTMPESLEYSVVAAIQNFWLAARAEGVGVGWVSIFRPERMIAILQCPPTWRLVAYLCVGYPIEEQATPELERLGWENRDSTQDAWQVR
jgi:5,6-dimethylbenzimidazole synthase